MSNNIILADRILSSDSIESTIRNYIRGVYDASGELVEDPYPNA